MTTEFRQEGFTAFLSVRDTLEIIRYFPESLEYFTVGDGLTISTPETGRQSLALFKVQPCLHGWANVCELLDGGEFVAPSSSEMLTERMYSKYLYLNPVKQDSSGCLPLFNQ